MKRALAILFALVAIVVAVLVALIVVRPQFAYPVLQLMGLQPESSQVANQESAGFSDVGDTVMTDEDVERATEKQIKEERTPLVAKADSVYLRSPILPADLTGVLFHQASYSYALYLETKLPEADYEKVLKKRQIRVNTKQTKGKWLDADALHLWRTSDATPMDTSIDVGALPGTIVRSPVSGTVVLVKDYKLYDEVPDIEIHIQPDGRPDLDCVLLHTADPLVSAGDRVEAGYTEISHVRDIEKDLTDVQLSFYTPEGVGGNHTHVQVNDATAKGYRKEKLKGAIKVD